jgi:hypothetical protein
MLITTNHPLVNELTKALGMPGNLTSFTIRGVVDGLVEVECTYLPSVVLNSKGEMPPVITKRYNLVERETA